VQVQLLSLAILCLALTYNRFAKQRLLDESEGQKRGIVEFFGFSQSSPCSALHGENEIACNDSHFENFAVTSE
jgi:hypothetical protein